MASICNASPEQFTFCPVQVNGTDVNPSDYSVTEKDLTLAKLPTGPIKLNIVTEIKPQENSSLEGLYKSSGNFCTQVLIVIDFLGKSNQALCSCMLPIIGQFFTTRALQQQPR